MQNGEACLEKRKQGQRKENGHLMIKSPQLVYALYQSIQAFS